MELAHHDHKDQVKHVSAEHQYHYLRRECTAAEAKFRIYNS